MGWFWHIRLFINVRISQQSSSFSGFWSILFSWSRSVVYVLKIYPDQKRPRVTCPGLPCRCFSQPFSNQINLKGESLIRFLTHRIHVCYIYLHFVDLYGTCIYIHYIYKYIYANIPFPWIRHCHDGPRWSKYRNIFLVECCDGFLKQPRLLDKLNTPWRSCRFHEGYIYIY